MLRNIDQQDARYWSVLLISLYSLIFYALSEKVKTPLTKQLESPDARLFSLWDKTFLRVRFPWKVLVRLFSFHKGHAVGSGADVGGDGGADGGKQGFVRPDAQIAKLLQ